MHEHPSRWTGGSLTDHMKHLLETAIPGSTATVQGGGGHFEIDVVSASFEGKSLLAKQRMVLEPISELMKGHDAPVHAIDRIATRTS